MRAGLCGAVGHRAPGARSRPPSCMTCVTRSAGAEAVSLPSRWSASARAAGDLSDGYFAACRWHPSACDAGQVLSERRGGPFNQAARTGGDFKMSPAILDFNLKLSTVTFVNSFNCSAGPA